MKRFSKTTFVVALVALIVVAVAIAGKPKWQKADEKVSDYIATVMERAVPYPQAQMKDSQERRNLRERLLRFNKQKKIGYVYLLGMNGNFVGYYAINGKVSSTSSQLTTTEQTWDCGNADGACSVPSIGDDGSFGPNEGGDDGVFFFTTNGVLVETTMDFIYSDSPLPVHAARLNPARGQQDLSNRKGR
jgi:hypothetical protein